MLPPIGVVAPVTAPPLTAVVLPLSACVTSAIDAAVAARVTGATLSAGASFGKKVKSDARFLAVSGVMATGAGMGPVSVTVTRWNAPTLTAGPTGLPVVGSSLVTSTSPRRIVIVERAGEISATTKVPRIAATALGVLISRVSPGFIPALLTATADRPAARKTVDIAGTSVIVRIDRSRAVTVALPPSRTRTADLSPVTIRSRRKTASLNLSSAGAGCAARVTVAAPNSMATTPTRGSSDHAGNGDAGMATVSKAKVRPPSARCDRVTRCDRVRGGGRVPIGSESKGDESRANQGNPANPIR